MFTERAFGEFYQRHARAVWTYVYRSTNNAADADDIVQDAFLRLLQADMVPADEEGLRRYVFRIAGNLMTDRWRKRTREKRHDTASTEQAEASPRDLDVARTFAELKPRERALLWLAYVEGDSHRDIGEALRLGGDSVKVMLSRARGRLRDLLKARGLIEGEQK